MDKKLNPLQIVARELSESSDIERDRIESAMTDLLEHLNARALVEINRDPESDEATAAAIQYRVVCELIATFGASLIAFEDMDEELSSGESN